MKDNELYETTIPGTPGRVTRGSADITDKLINTTGKVAPPGTYTVGVCKVEQVCGRIERTIDIGKAVEMVAAERCVPVDVLLGQSQGGNVEDGKAFLDNRARQMGLRNYQKAAVKGTLEASKHYVGRDVQVEYSFGPEDADPKRLEFKPLGIVRLEIISHDEAVPCGDDAVSQGFLTRWLPLYDPAAPSPAFPHGFADTICFPMRKGIGMITVRRKAK